MSLLGIIIVCVIVAFVVGVAAAVYKASLADTGADSPISDEADSQYKPPPAAPPPPH